MVLYQVTIEIVHIAPPACTEAVLRSGGMNMTLW